MKRNLVTLSIVGIFIAVVIGINRFEPQRVSEHLRAEELRKTEEEARVRTALAQARLSERDRIVQEENAEFFEMNAKREEVHSLPSGLQYRIVKEGTGRMPTARDTVVTHYRGRLLDGTMFDSSYKRGQPALFNVSEVIRGWTEVLQLMKEGASWEVWIPSELAYGSTGQKPLIAGYAALVFDLELIKIKN